MGISSLEEREIEEFLAAKPSWLRKVIQGDFALTREEQSHLVESNWPEIFGQARDKYLRLLQRCPKRLREYRRREAKLATEYAVSGLPSVPRGRPREDALAQEVKDLARAGMSHAEIARRLNLEYPDRKDRKGNRRTITAEAVRKLLASRKQEARTKPTDTFFLPEKIRR